jgi:RHS repeat-associated protein
VVQRYAYSSFGKIESQLDANFVQPYTFTSRELDPETQLFHYRERQYDPNAGRFLAEDPLGFNSGEENFYLYTAGNPINFTDPEGLLLWGAIDAGEAYGHAAAEYWANRSLAPTNKWYETALYNFMGGLASLWTACTSDDTMLTLFGSGGMGRYFARPFWRYIGPNSNPVSRWIARGPGWKPPYGTDFAKAKDALQMPHMPSSLEKVKVRWYEPVRGPRPANMHPDWGKGGGYESYRGWRFPE